MGTFAQTKRNIYSSDKVRQMRSERKKKKGTIAGKEQNYQFCLGDLIGAGHLKITGFQHMEKELETGTFINVTNHTIRFSTHNEADGRGERAHLSGYLSSGHPHDPMFKLKGWFNEDGTIRIELVKN